MYTVSRRIADIERKLTLPTPLPPPHACPVQASMR